MDNTSNQSEGVLLGELQVLFSEKRTYLSILRTGIAIITVPFTIIVFLVATIPYHHVFDRVWLGGVIVAVLVGISIAGTYVSYQAGRKIEKLNKRLREAKKNNALVDDIIV